MWPVVTKAVNDGEGLDLSIGAVKWRYYNGDEMVTRYHSIELGRRAKDNNRRLAVVKENRKAVKSVLKEMEEVIKQSSMGGR